jgi:hypothetical protein
MNGRGSNMLLQLNPQIPLDTPKGKGRAVFVSEGGEDSDMTWVVFINETGECWTFRNRDVLAVRNITYGTRVDKK